MPCLNTSVFAQIHDKEKRFQFVQNVVDLLNTQEPLHV